MTTKLFDTRIVSSEEQALDFLGNILESSTEYSIIGKDLDGKILLWNEGARRLYGYEPDEVVGKVNSSILHTPEDVTAGKPRETMEAALRDGKWEGTIVRLRKDGQRFTARVVLTPRRDARGKPIGFLLISKDISNEIRLTEELQATQFYTRSLIESNIDPLMTTDALDLVLDVVMPKLDGQQLYVHMCAMKPEVPAIFTTGYGTEAAALSELVEKGVAVLPKPYTPPNWGARFARPWMVRCRRPRPTPHVPRAAMDKPAARPKPLRGSRCGNTWRRVGARGSTPPQFKLTRPAGCAISRCKTGREVVGLLEVANAL